jgi:hypothetical protein
MELQAPIPFPPAADAAEDAALTELDVAIALVTGGVARRIRIASVAIEIADRVSGIGAARAQAAGLRFIVERSGSCATFTVGPRG